MLLAVTLISPALADEPDGPDDVRPTPPQEAPLPPPPPQPPPRPLPPPPPIQPQPPQQFVQERNEEALRLERSGKAMVGGGAFLLALGAALEVTGIVMSAYSQFGHFDPVCPTCDDPRTPYLATGLVASLAAGGMIYGGLAVLSAGKNRIRRAKVIKLHMSFGSQEVRAQVGFTF